MSNFSIKIDLLKMKGAFVSNLQGRTATKKCICIPVESAGLYVGEKGVYLNLTSIEMQEPRYGDTHYVKVSVDREVFRTLSEEERRAIPILGGMHEFEARAAAPVNAAVENAPKAYAAPAEDGTDDLPF